MELLGGDMAKENNYDGYSIENHAVIKASRKQRQSGVSARRNTSQETLKGKNRKLNK